MVEAAKGAAANPENEDQQQRLREAAEGLRVATNAAAQNAIKKKIVNRLEVAAKQAAAAATQAIAAAQNAAMSNKNAAAQQQLVQSCKVRGRWPESRSAVHQPDSIRAPCAPVIWLRPITQTPNPVYSGSPVGGVHTPGFCLLRGWPVFGGRV